MLTESELERYDRQIIMAGFGKEGQEKLKRAHVFVAGTGGLGSPICIYLAAAGVGRLRLVDHGNIELSNLNRQILHWTEDIGRPKIESAAEKLKKLNPDIEIEAIKETIAGDNVERLVNGCDLIVDAMDNMPARYILNNLAVKRGIPFFHGAAYGFEARAMTIIPGKTACLRCLYQAVPPPEKFPVVGVAPAVVGSIQAAEVIKYITGIGELLTNRLIIYDGLTSQFMECTVKKNPDCDCCT